MVHHSPLIGTIVAGLVVAFVMGALAQRLKVSPIAGYLLAGVMVGPSTPGYVADSGLANELAEIGVILLMFGVGLHFSLKELLSVRAIAVPGALVQIAVATLLGMGLAAMLGWGLAAGFVFGLALSVASTVVLLRALQSRSLVQTERGRIAVGWLIVEDLAMVLALVLLPVMARIISGGTAGGLSALVVPLALTFLKVAIFIGLMLVVGRRVIPSALHWVAHTGSRELFRLAVLAIALGVAFGAAFLFDISFALGAFFAGMILGETPLSRRATEETLPLRDAFAVLFFVSVGMLFDPAVVVEQPLPLAGTVAIILFGKSAAAYLIVRAFGHSNIQALTIASSLAQIGEFSFILAALGTQLGMLPQEGRDLILAGAIISIFLNPFVFTLILSREKLAEKAGRTAEEPAAAAPPPPSDHVILAGYGRVGRLIARELKRAGRPFVLIEDQPDIARRAEADGMTVLASNAIDQQALEKAGVQRAGKLLLAIPEGYEAGAIFERARALNPAIRVIARAHSDAEAEHLQRLGVTEIITGEREIADRMLSLCGQRLMG
ncbi:sodium:proton antiporter [Sphingobium jiangsuense]|uniref:CPA2 family monovalent cation:H+ antiporter-2 n=1 Tax=Sphingobium jiangsuense TaxID=870476 RepID=A0A7W6FS66_9SPHN|nr:YbaL family putative K(+) efflux transporter [Sphingobium jiangsuense]MBB3928422.1 CPA2 family monovalent cation:H+ antiporter-2 [Sphingobium jiangsuense]GLT02433.1 sodium:proton antiporter [Sphingobium jiangsuense]